MPKNGRIGSMAAELDAWIAAREKAPSAGGAAVAAARPRPSDIVLIDDDDDYRGLVRSLLQENAFQVREAGDGAQGLALITQKLPDAVLMDFNMPKLNGYELIQELRRRFETRHVPIVLFSGAPNRRRIREIGLDVSAFLDKPVANAKLLETVRGALSGREPPPLTLAAPPEAEAGAAEPLAAPASASMDIAAGAAGSSSDDQLLEQIQIEAAHTQPAEAAAPEAPGSDSPLIAWVNRILVRAVEKKASDIHIEPQENEIIVRLRLDGSLQTLYHLPGALKARLASRLKIMSNLVITEHRLPQDGQFRAQIRGQKIEFRVSTLPSLHGEKIVLRVLGQGKLKGEVSSLALSERDRDCVAKTLKSPNGLILVTGPTGSGKTTTLYSMISAVNTRDVNILTAEDPVEYQLPGITQVPVHPAIGLTFESVLRSFLRQDPDIMLVGEIRDKETAEIAVKASITGHLVFSTLHTNSAPATVTRLTHMGLAPFLVAASVRLIIAQRLVKLLCERCRKPACLSEEDKKFLTGAEVKALARTFEPQGCEACGKTGYAGRIPVFEVLPISTPRMRRLIIDSASLDDLAQQAESEGMNPLRRAALGAVEDGRTSLHEAFKIILSE